MSNDKKKTTANEALSTEAPASGRSWTRWILPTVGLVALIFLGLVIRDRLQSEVWSYYTDEEGLRVDVQEKKERMVLWEDPKQSLFQERDKNPENAETVDPVNQASQSLEAAFSSDGTLMVLTVCQMTLRKRALKRPAPTSISPVGMGESGADRRR